MTNSEIKSVHLQDYPNISKIDDNLELINSMDVIRDVCSTALAIRDKKNLRVRLPLANIRIIGNNASKLKEYSDIILDEVNVKNVEFVDEIGDLANLTLQINFKKVGSKLGAKMKEVLKASKQGFWEKKEDGKVQVLDVTLEAGEYEIKLLPKNVENTMPLSTNDALVELDTELTEELIVEGTSRDLVRLIQQYRKEADLDISDRINVDIISDSEKVKEAINAHRDYIKEQTLSLEVNLVEKSDKKHSFANKLDEKEITIKFKKA